MKYFLNRSPCWLKIEILFLIFKEVHIFCFDLLVPSSIEFFCFLIQQTFSPMKFEIPWCIKGYKFLFCYLLLVFVCLFCYLNFLYVFVLYGVNRNK